MGQQGGYPQMYGPMMGHPMQAQQLAQAGAFYPPYYAGPGLQPGPGQYQQPMGMMQQQGWQQPNFGTMAGPSWQGQQGVP